MKRRFIFFALFLFASSVSAEIRVYTVDLTRYERIYHALNGVLSVSSSGSPSGVIERLPDGQLLINTSPELHADIEKVLAAISKNPIAKPESARVEYLVVKYQPGEQPLQVEPSLESDGWFGEFIDGGLFGDTGTLGLLYESSSLSEIGRSTSVDSTSGSHRLVLSKQGERLRVSFDLSVVDNGQRTSWEATTDLELDVPVILFETVYELGAEKGVKGTYYLAIRWTDQG